MSYCQTTATNPTPGPPPYPRGLLGQRPGLAPQMGACTISRVRAPKKQGLALIASAPTPVRTMPCARPRTRLLHAGIGTLPRVGGGGAGPVGRNPFPGPARTLAVAVPRLRSRVGGVCTDDTWRRPHFPFLRDDSVFPSKRIRHWFVARRPRELRGMRAGRHDSACLGIPMCRNSQ